MKRNKAFAAAVALCRPMTEAERPAREREFQRLLALAIPQKSLARFRAVHQGRRAFIVGTSPSLGTMNLKPLQREVTFGCNAVFRHPHFQPTYYMANDVAANAKLRHEVNEWHRASTAVRFHLIPSQIGKGTVAGIQALVDVDFRAARVYPLWTIPKWIDEPCFSTDADRGVGQNGTTIYFLLQLVFYMGCDPVYIIGIDCTAGYYKGSRKPANKLAPQETWDMVWNRWALARKALERDGRRIYNATPGGRCKVFERADFGKLF